MSSRPARAQRGVVLFIALIILVAMSLAGIALMRGVDTGTVIAGNLAFRQSTTFVGDIGVEAARAWLRTAANLNATSTADSYCASWNEGFNLLANFDGSCAGTSKDVTAAPYTPPSGYTVKYVIHRLCTQALPPDDPNNSCVKSFGTATATTGGTKGAAAYGTYALSSPVAAVYRVTVQVTGPRNARSYVQSVVF